MKTFFFLLVAVQILGLLLVKDYASGFVFHMSILLFFVLAILVSVSSMGIKMAQQADEKKVNKSINATLGILITGVVMFVFPRIYSWLILGKINMCPYTLIEEGYKHPDSGYGIQGWALIFVTIFFSWRIVSAIFKKPTNEQ